MIPLDGGEQSVEVRSRCWRPSGPARCGTAGSSRIRGLTPGIVFEIVVLLVDDIESVGGETWQFGVRLKLIQPPGAIGVRLGPIRRMISHLLLDRIDVSGAGLGAVAKEQFRRRADEAHHHDTDADIGNRVVGVLHVDAQISLDAVAEERSGAGAAELVRHDRRHEYVAA